MDKRFEIIIKDTKTGESKTVDFIGDDWINPVDDKEFEADIDTIVDSLKASIDSGVVFGL